MIAENALYDTISDAVTAAAEGDPLYGASVFSSTRGSANLTARTVRVQVLNGMLAPQSGDPELKEHHCEFVVQCLSKAAAAGLEAEQAAQADADAIGMAVLELLLLDSSLGGAVCTLDMFGRDRNFDRAVIDLGAAKHGSFYLYGEVNPIG